ncbi:MAG: hypothetical protein GKR91_15235 [Pseudomonadales bacterium]|nr:hypothetical protein [Pseudomonadales bacterium]
MEQSYNSKIDFWFGAVLTVSIISCLIMFYIALQEGSITIVLIALPILFIGSVLPFWLLMNTNYSLGNTTLLVRCGPFRWKVLVKDIESVTPTASPLSGPALSIDRLRIEYGSGRWIVVSPKLKNEFLQDLEFRRSNHDN